MNNLVLYFSTISNNNIKRLNRLIDDLKGIFYNVHCISNSISDTYFSLDNFIDGFERSEIFIDIDKARNMIAKHHIKLLN